MASPSPSPPAFVPDNVLPPGPAGDESPALSSSKALARFEFESGRGNEGTKVLMVEWETEAETANAGDWRIEWPGKTTVVSAKDGVDGPLHRVYFLLAPGASVPARVTLSQDGYTLQTNPLPAIFPPELGITARTAGKKGVLHTVWGKQRLSVLQKEIEAEMAKNGEGIGLEMARQEKQWIEDNFGVSARSVERPPISPTSPKSPSGGRLAEKLKSLKLGTSAPELLDQSNRPIANPLSPDVGDVAVSSFSVFHGTTPRPLPRGTVQVAPLQPTSRLNISRPTTRLNSMDAIATGHVDKNDDPELEDGLFAVRMSPRSPEMTKSPFSFSATDNAQSDPLKNNE